MVTGLALQCLFLGVGIIVFMVIESLYSYDDDNLTFNEQKAAGGADVPCLVQEAALRYFLSLCIRCLLIERGLAYVQREEVFLASLKPPLNY
jgi:hypothetical protein